MIDRGGPWHEMIISYRWIYKDRINAQVVILNIRETAVLVAMPDDVIVVQYLLAFIFYIDPAFSVIGNNIVMQAESCQAYRIIFWERNLYPPE